MLQNETLNHDFLGDDPVRSLYIFMIQSKKKQKQTAKKNKKKKCM